MGWVRRVGVLVAGILAGFAAGYFGALLVLGKGEVPISVAAVVVSLPVLALFVRELVACWKDEGRPVSQPRASVVDPELTDISIWDVSRSLDAAVE